MQSLYIGEILAQVRLLVLLASFHLHGGGLQSREGSIPLTQYSALWVQEGDESYPLFVKERGAILDSLKARAKVSKGCAGPLCERRCQVTRKSSVNGAAEVSRNTLGYASLSAS